MNFNGKIIGEGLDTQSISGEILFDNLSKKEKVIFTYYNMMDWDDYRVIFTDEYPLGTTLIRFLNFDIITDINCFKEKLKNCVININCHETLGEIAKRVNATEIFDDDLYLNYLINFFNDNLRLLDEKEQELLRPSEFAPFDKLYNEICEIILNCTNREFISELDLFLKNTCLELSENYFVNVYGRVISDEEKEFFSTQDDVNEDRASYDTKDILKEIFRKMFMALLFVNETLKVHEYYTEYVNNICCLGFREYLDNLDNLKRAYLYQQNNYKFQFQNLFDYRRKLSFDTVEENISFVLDFVKPEKQADIIDGVKISYIEHIHLSDIHSLANFTLMRLIQNNIKVQICPNCGRFFIPQVARNTIYCNEPAPKNPSKTCREYIKTEVYYKKMKENPLKYRERRIYQRKQKLASRNPDIAEYKIDYENFQNKAREMNIGLKNNIISVEEYEKWLNSQERKGGN